MHGTIMTKGKKHRLVEARTPAGRISRAGEAREFAPTQAKRLRDAAMRQMMDPEWGTELGILFLQERITQSMYAAGKKWREMASKYQASIGAFPVRATSVELGRKGSPPDPESEAGCRIAKREANLAEDFFAADAVLVNAGPGIRLMVRRVCEDDAAPIGLDELARFRAGLMRLVSHWNLTNEKKLATDR